MLLVNTAGIDGAPKRLLTTGAVVVTGGGGVKSGCVKSGCVKPFRFRPATPENKVKITDYCSSFHVTFKNMVGHEYNFSQIPYCCHPSV